jgi:hypothetical protein
MCFCAYPAYASLRGFPRTGHPGHSPPETPRARFEFKVGQELKFRDQNVNASPPRKALADCTRYSVRPSGLKNGR